MEGGGTAPVTAASSPERFTARADGENGSWGCGTNVLLGSGPTVEDGDLARNEKGKERRGGASFPCEGKGRVPKRPPPATQATSRCAPAMALCAPGACDDLPRVCAAESACKNYENRRGLNVRLHSSFAATGVARAGTIPLSCSSLAGFTQGLFGQGQPSKVKRQNHKDTTGLILAITADDEQAAAFILRDRAASCRRARVLDRNSCTPKELRRHSPARPPSGAQSRSARPQMFELGTSERRLPSSRNRATKDYSCRPNSREILEFLPTAHCVSAYSCCCCCMSHRLARESAGGLRCALSSDNNPPHRTRN